MCPVVSVSLRKWDPSCRYRCENSPWRAAPGPRRPEATRYSRQNGPRAASAFQRDALGQETTHWGRQFAYPNALLPTPMRGGTRSCLPQCGKALAVAYPNTGRHSQLPAPMPSCLPQCGKALAVAYPNAARHSQLPAPMGQSTPRCPPQCGKARNRPPGPPFQGGASAHMSFCS